MTDDDPSSLITVPEPFPISLVSGNYLIYDIDTITYVRREHHICGVLLGTLPRIPQQNVFLGVPLHLMPEEARVLVEKGAAFVVDDVEAHSEGLSGLSEAEKQAFRRDLAREGREAAGNAERRTEARKEKALKRLGRLPEDHPSSPTPMSKRKDVEDPTEDDEDTSLFTSPAPPGRPISPTPSSLTTSTTVPALQPYPITPTTSHPPLPKPALPHAPSSDHLPPVPPTAYPLYAHLHSLNYFMTPGLRFGCQYSVYPGDPLRFHSHFLAIGAGWDEPLDLLGLVGGGRLGTGVKKGFLLGGEEPSPPSDSPAVSSPPRPKRKVRTFCIEWASM